MKNRAFSLIEVVLSLALMSVLVTTALLWTSATLRIQSDRDRSVRTARSMEMVERSIRVDLFQFDASLNINRPRIIVSDTDLRIRTRDSGPSTVRYVFDSESNAIIRSDPFTHHRIIANADSLTVELETSQDSRTATLRITVIATDNNYTFIHQIPARWIR